VLSSTRTVTLTFRDRRGLRADRAGGAVCHEENVSAEQSAEKADARVSRANGDARGPDGAQATAGQGAKAAHRLHPAEAARVRAALPQSLRKEARLRRRREFLRLQRDGRAQHSEHFVVLKAAATTAGSRLGITVSSRVGNAVVRNRVKRLVRESVRRLLPAIDPPLDMVVIAKPGAAQTGYAQAATELRRALGIKVD
jgi:ribonuclease P protein component